MVGVQEEALGHRPQLLVEASARVAIPCPVAQIVTQAESVGSRSARREVKAQQRTGRRSRTVQASELDDELPRFRLLTKEEQVAGIGENVAGGDVDQFPGLGIVVEGESGAQQ